MRVYEERHFPGKLLDSVSTGVGTETILVTVVLAMTLAGGFFLRIESLGAHGLWTDELYHALAAKSLLTEGRPYIPIMGEYTRALPFTWLVAASFKLLGVSEFAARLPSALIGTAFIAVVFLLVRKLFNTPIALLTTLMVSLSPLFIDLSRESRMYPLFQLLFLSGTYFFFTGFEPQSPDGRYRSGMHFGRLVLAAVFLLFSLSIHLLTINFGLVLAVYLLVMWAYSLLQPGQERVAFRKHTVLVAVMATAGLLMFILAGDRLAALLEFARMVPAFSTRELTDYGYYRYYLSDNYPALFFLYPLSVLLMVRAYGRKALFFSLMFFILMLAHTFLFGRKLDRYFFYILPFFFLGVSYAVWRIMHFFWEETRLGTNSHAGYALGLACLAVAFNVFGYPWLANSRHVPGQFKHTDWKTLDAAILQEVGTGAVMTSRYKAYLYYFDDIPEYVIMKSGDRLLDERYSLLPRINNVDDLRSHFDRENGPLFMVLDEWSFNNRAYFDQQMRDFVLANCESVLHQGDKKIMIFKKKV